MIRQTLQDVTMVRHTLAVANSLVADEVAISPGGEL